LPHDGFDIHCCDGRLLRSGRLLRQVLREALNPGGFMEHNWENIIVGIVALLLFIYLFVAMIRPEKF
jgi:K+-transporting ATPase KdpF subunit